MHECPKHGCTQKVPTEQLSCSRHWYQVSKPTRDRVWRAYRIGERAEHASAVAAAIDEMNATTRP